MNRELAARVRNHIANGAPVDMTEWRSPSGACCIGGWALVLSGYLLVEEPPSRLERVLGVRMMRPDIVCQLGESTVQPFDAAQLVLGLTDSEVDALFFADNWPADLQDAFAAAELAGDMDAMRAVAVERLDRFLGTTAEAIGEQARAAGLGRPARVAPDVPHFV